MKFYIISGALVFSTFLGGCVQLDAPEAVDPIRTSTTTLTSARLERSAPHARMVAEDPWGTEARPQMSNDNPYETSSEQSSSELPPRTFDLSSQRTWGGAPELEENPYASR